MAMRAKTNVMRILDAKKIKYSCYSYSVDAGLTGAEIANILGQNAAQVFKTLVTVSKTNKIYVFMVPVNCELDLKRAANVVGEKSIDMLKSRDLLGLTGYVHGGCSPIGMKKQFITVIDSSAKVFDTIIFSAGVVGRQVHMGLDDLESVVPLRFADVCAE